jgi:serine phosphatase RsbU (regulator of sigma subunit)
VTDAEPAIGRTGGLDAVSLLRALVSHRLPAVVLDEARARGARSAALYVIDIDGSCLMKLDGDEPFPDVLDLPFGVGPEMPVEAIAGVAAHVQMKLADTATLAMRVRDRAVGVLLATGGDRHALQELADQAGLALELDGGYTDVLHRARRRRTVEPAAEIQQDLMPPRIAALHRGSVAAGVLPGYDVGGDFFDYAENAEGLWLTVADAMGKGTAAAAMSSIAIGALRAARRNNDDLHAVATLMHETILQLTDGDSYTTAIVALWDADAQILRWINCGHPRPLLLDPGGSVEELRGVPVPPLGLLGRGREFPIAEHRFGPGQRLLLYSDGVSERRDAEGRPMGVDRVKALLAETAGQTAAHSVRQIQNAVTDRSRRPLRDDATLLVLNAH